MVFRIQTISRTRSQCKGVIIIIKSMLTKDSALQLLPIDDKLDRMWSLIPGWLGLNMTERNEELKKSYLYNKGAHLQHTSGAPTEQTSDL